MSLSFNKNYPYKVWLGAILLGSLLLSFALVVQNGPPPGLSMAFAVMINILFYALAFSWPAFLFFYFTFRFLRHKDIAASTAKLILCLAGAVAIIITFEFFELSFFSLTEYSIITWSYFAAFLITCLGYKIAMVKKR